MKLQLSGLNPLPITQPTDPGFFQRISKLREGTEKDNLDSPIPLTQGNNDTLSKTQATGQSLQQVSFVEHKPAAGSDFAQKASQAITEGVNPGQPGPFKVKKIEMQLAGSDVDVYMPVGKGPFPVNVYASGLSHGQRNATSNGNHFASWGMVTIVPALAGNMNPMGSSRKVEKIVEAMSQKNMLEGTPVQSDAIAVSGHSFGGLTASLAADHPKVTALLALDPNDNLLQFNPGRKNASDVHVPSAFIFGDGGPNSLGPGIYKKLSSPSKFAIRLNDMPHLNFTSTSEFPNKRGQQRALDFATAFLLHELGNVVPAQRFLPGGGEIEAGIQNGELNAL